MAQTNSYFTNHKSFVMYKEWTAHISLLTNEETGRLMKAVFHFVETGEATPLGDRAMEIIFNMMRECITRDSEKWEETRRIRSECGAKGGRPRKQPETPDL